MKAETINQSLKTIIPEDLLQVVLKLQELRKPIEKYTKTLKDRIAIKEERSQRWDRADEIVSHINLAIVDLADLLSMEFVDKIID